MKIIPLYQRIIMFAVAILAGFVLSSAWSGLQETAMFFLFFAVWIAMVSPMLYFNAKEDLASKNK